jgi:probable HAF family extracellular repeat protein
MNTAKRWLGLAAAIAALALGPPARPGPAPVPGPGFNDLGVLPGGNFSEATGINQAGEVVGRSTLPLENFFVSHAFFWSEAAGLVDLGTLPGFDQSFAAAINDQRQVVGNSTNLLGMGHAFLFELDAQGGVLARHDLGTLPGGRGSAATAINNLGQVVGWSEIEVGDELEIHAFFWSEATGMVDLGTLPGGIQSFALGINDLATIVGVAATETGECRGFIFFPGQPGGLDSLLLQPPQGPEYVDLGSTIAYSVNNLGHVAGAVYRPGLSCLAVVAGRPLLWLDPESFEDLGLVPGGRRGHARGINIRDQVVGQADTATGELSRGFVSLPGGTIHDLSRPVGSQFLEVLDGSAINAAGQIAAFGSLGDGDAHALRLELCPANVTARLRVDARAPVFNRRRRTFTQRLRIRNVGGAPLQGGLVLALDNLPAAVMLLDAAGRTACAAPLGAPFVRLEVGGDGVLAAGETAIAVLEFQSPNRRAIGYVPRFLAGGTVP